MLFNLFHILSSSFNRLLSRLLNSFELFLRFLDRSSKSMIIRLFSTRLQPKTHFTERFDVIHLGNIRLEDLQPLLCFFEFFFGSLSLFSSFFDRGLEGVECLIALVFTGEQFLPSLLAFLLDFLNLFEQSFFLSTKPIRVRLHNTSTTLAINIFRTPLADQATLELLS